MPPTSIPYLCAQIQGEVTLQVGCVETNTFSSLSRVQQSYYKENGVPGVKHHTSNIHHLKWYKSNWFPHVVFLNRYHHVDFTLVFICFLLALYRLNSLEALICQLYINYILHHMYAYIQGELSLCNVRVKLCDLFVGGTTLDTHDKLQGLCSQGRSSPQD